MNENTEHCFSFLYEASGYRVVQPHSKNPVKCAAFAVLYERGTQIMNIRYLLAVSVIIFFIFSNPATAFKVLEEGESVSADTVIDDDLYIAGDNVIIKGVVLGDVVALGGLVEISGNVTGDVIACGGNVIINGYVGDDVRAGTGLLMVNGHVGGDLVAGAGNIIVSEDADIGGDVVFGCGQMELMGDVGGDVTGGTGDMTLAGNVGGDVELEVGELNLLPGARITGNLTYTGLKEATIPSGAVFKDTNFIKKEERIGVSPIMGWLARYLSLLVIGLLALALLPNRTAAISRAIPDRSLTNLALGVLLVVAGSVGSILFFITVIGIPLGMLLLFATAAVLYAARLFIGLWLGRVIFSRLGRESRPWMDMVLGLFVLFILTSLPWIGFLIYLLVTFIAIGSLFSEEKRFCTELREKGML